MDDMSKLQIKQLLRIARAPEMVLKANMTLLDLCKRFNMAKPMGNWVHLKEEDKRKAKDLLALQMIDADKVDPEDWNGLTRVEALALGANEKLATGPVKRNLVSVKALAGGRLKQGADPSTHITLPSASYLIIDWKMIATWQHNCIMVVENFEAFEQVHQINIHPGKWDPLVVYRGDPKESGADIVKALLTSADKPVFYLGDMDPAGLQIGLSLPGFSGIVLPSTADLQHALKMCPQKKLFDKQIAGTRRRIEASQNPSIMRAWAAILEAEAGFAQEYWVGKGYRHYLG